MKCPNCGETFFRKHTFCVVCGADLTGSAPSTKKADAAPMPAAPAPTPPEPPRKLTAEDFFGTATPQKRETHMSEVSVSELDVSKLEQLHAPHVENHYMKSAGEADASQLPAHQRTVPNVVMHGAGSADSASLESYVHTAPIVNMDAANGVDESNLRVSSSTVVPMSDELHPVDPGPAKRPPRLDPLEDIEIPSFIRARRKHSISLDPPTIESI